LSTLDLKPGRPVRRSIGGAPEGQDARILANLAAMAGPAGVIHVTTDDARAARLADAVAFFAPAVDVIVFPAWDCLPYDRVSPNPDIVSRRIDALGRLLAPSSAPRLCITTVNAALQRVMPRESLAGSTFRARKGERVDVASLQSFLAHNGYVRAQTVREPGEFAIRGGIIDLFPPGTDEPLRLDLFGDELEGVRAFDPMSQRTTEARDGFEMRPMAEVFLDEPSIARFRAGYREQFGAVLDDDPLYEAVSAGRRYGGVEHWMPLFHARLDTLFDYLPEAAIVLDDQAEASADERFAQIADFHASRKAFQVVERKSNVPVYKPLPTALLYLDRASFDAVLARRPVGVLSPFAPAEGSGGFDADGRRGHDFADARAKPDVNVFDAVKAHIAEIQRDGKRVIIAGTSPGARDRLLSVLHGHGIEQVRPAESHDEVRRLPRGTAGAVVLSLERGFVASDLAVVTEQDILGDRLSRPTRKRKRAANFIAELSTLNPGDYVVHVDHGIGRFDGLETLVVGGAPHDCLRIVYDGGDKLFLPVENLELLSRYGSEDTSAQLDKLGGVGWQNRKARVKRKLKDMAEALLKIAAERQLRTATPIAPPEGLFQEFCARFPYTETEDQLRAIEEVIDDLGSGRPMDRLVCGDVGFGKTEVALRAAFCMAMSGQQVAVVVPTTLLARQHFRNFTNRFRGIPLSIVQMSRMATPKEMAQAKAGLADGTVDIVIGTHAILAKGLEFKRLGLVVVDEEQHFGVKQKERLKSLRADVHVLTLTATPIPRTLQMALSGVRELSLIATPPVDRLAVRTFVLPYDPVVIREALMREHYRGGQSFYVCPRIEDLATVAERLRELVPELKIVSAHGQMPSASLEEVMSAFDQRQFDVLLSTNIVESGLDIPNANTLIIHRADLFGLAGLYQLRGRIGRSKVRGYAYLTYQPRVVLSQTAQQRLHVIETLDSLGAGFQLASHDMDIRGAGNLLGEEQSGHIKEVGVELYQTMLEEAVANVRSSAQPRDEIGSWTPQINLGTPVLIPETYVQDLNVRLSLYRRLADLIDQQEIEGFAAELIDRFGPLPQEVDNLLEVMTLKQLCRQARVERVDAGPKGAVVGFRENRFDRPEKLLEMIQRKGGTIKVRPDQRLVLVAAWDEPRQRVKGVLRLVRDLAQMAA
jgi:transcription-repair coupling factor (superfamily II helicase)